MAFNVALGLWSGRTSDGAQGGTTYTTNPWELIMQVPDLESPSSSKYRQQLTQLTDSGTSGWWYEVSRHESRSKF